MNADVEAYAGPRYYYAGAQPHEWLPGDPYPGAEFYWRSETLMGSTETAHAWTDAVIETPRVVPSPQRIEVLRKLDVESMLARKPPPIPWLVEPLLIPGELTMLTGREGRGKSMLSQALAVAIADETAGGQVLGMSVAIGNVLIVDAENGPNEIHRRLHGTGLRDPARYHVYEAAGLRLRDQEHLAKLHELVRAERPTVVVLDSLVSLAPGLRENDAHEVQPLMQGIQAIARDTGAAILLLHHAGKGDTGADYRGSSAIGGVVTLAVSMIAHDGDPDPARRELRWWKCRPCAKPEPIWLQITTEGGRLQLLPAEPFDNTGVPGAPVRSELKDEIVAALRDGGPAPSAAEVARRVGRRRDDKTFREALAMLEGLQVVTKDAKGVRLQGVPLPVVPPVVPTTPGTTERGVVPETPGGAGHHTTPGDAWEEAL